MDKNSKVLVIGHDGIIENALSGFLKTGGFQHVLSSTAEDLDVLDQKAVANFFALEKPEYVFLSSVRSGGIEANQKFAADFIFENLQAQNNVIHAAFENGTKKLLYYAASCVYPKESPSPIREESLLTGPLEPTSEPYSIAKIAGIKLCQSFRWQHGFNAIVAVPPTVYGPGSDTDVTTAHVMGALIGKFSDAVSENKPEVAIWGSGKPCREFLYADDFAAASIFLMDHYDEDGVINVGSGEDVSIKVLAEIIQDISDFKGKVVFDQTKPDGTLKKLLDNTRIAKLGWKPKVALREGIKKTYEWYSQANAKS
jgi:GDP-L-fucose synthase